MPKPWVGYGSSPTLSSANMGKSLSDTILHRVNRVIRFSHSRPIGTLHQPPPSLGGRGSEGGVPTRTMETLWYIRYTVVYMYISSNFCEGVFLGL
jgi:hypothetical protein